MDPLRRELFRPPRAHEVEVVRNGDFAEIKRDHCAQETGLVVQVVGTPHRAIGRCHKCGQKVDEIIVEIFAMHGPWLKIPGPWFHPVAWLKRIDPRDPTRFARMAKYQQVLASPEQWH